MSEHLEWKKDFETCPASKENLNRGTILGKFSPYIIKSTIFIWLLKLLLSAYALIIRDSLLVQVIHRNLLSIWKKWHALPCFCSVHPLVVKKVNHYKDLPFWHLYFIAHPDINNRFLLLYDICFTTCSIFIPKKYILYYCIWFLKSWPGSIPKTCFNFIKKNVLTFCRNVRCPCWSFIKSDSDTPCSYWF